MTGEHYDNYIAPIHRSIETLKKKIEALTNEEKKFSKELIKKLSKWQKDMAHKIEALESAQKWILNILCSDDYGSIIPQLKELKKKLEAK